MNEQQIRYAIDLIKQNGLVEVRILQGKKSISGYFKDVDNIIREIKRYEDANIYFVLNEINDACYSREQKEKLYENPKNTTSDTDISKREWVLIDIDPVRPSGVSATDDEKKHAMEIGNKVFKFLRDAGFAEPVCADSGNGVHLLYKVSMANDAANAELIKKFLQVLDLYFSDNHAQVDKSVFNASRITKLYGTSSRKGNSDVLRPHRLSGIVKCPKEIKMSPIALFERIANMLPEQEKPSYNNNYNADFNLDDFISKHNIAVTKIESYGGGRKFILDNCLFDSSHKGKDACIFQMSNGAIGYKCLHNSCSGHKWADVRNKFEPSRYVNQKTDYRKARVETQPVNDEPTKDLFLNFSDIKTKSRNSIVSIPSGYADLDKKIGGFNKGEISMWSGMNGSAKSTILNHIAINAIHAGYKVALFSGEMIPSRIKDWTHLQCAGRQYTEPTTLEGFYKVDSQIKDRIDLWLKDKFYIFNNEVGNSFNKIMYAMDKIVKEQNIDMIILDNLMAMNISELASDKNSQQSNAILELSNFVKKNNIHLHMVAHPRKAGGFLRKDDIAGSSDLSNAVENVFIAHRVNNDFIRLAGDFFGEKVASQYHSFTNVIEVCKNRDLGVVDFMVGLFYEPESKRLLNVRFENVCYGWQDIEIQQSIQPNYDFDNQQLYPF